MFQMKSRTNGAITMGVILAFVIGLILLMAVAIPIFIDQQSALSANLTATQNTVLDATGVILIVAVLALVAGLVALAAKGV